MAMGISTLDTCAVTICSSDQETSYAAILQLL